MREIFINKAKTCAFTGHRAIPKDFNIEKLKTIILKIIENGYDTFLIGMAVGFDTICFEILEEFRKAFPIKIVACVPCANQDQKFNIYQREKYKNMLESADSVVCLSFTYTNTCMQKRNKYMVDHSSLLIAYIKHNYGGTKNTVEYAKTRDTKIIYV